MGGRALILLDTHVLLWLDAGSPKLGRKTRRELDRALAAGELSVSAITFWELGTLLGKGRISLGRDLESWRSALLEAGLEEVAITGDLGARAARLDDFHGDPADRLIVATTLRDGAVLCTADQQILDWSGPVRRLDARG